MNAQLVGNMPYLATLPSCVLYLRPYGTPSGGTTFKDWSLKARTLTRINSPVNTTTSPKFPTGAMDFTSSYAMLTAAASSDFNFTGNLAFQLWVKMASNTTDRIFWGSANTLAEQFHVESNHLFQYYDGTTNRTLSSTTVDDGAWHHLAVIKTGTTLQGYVDGSAGTAVTGVSGTLGGSSMTFYIMGFYSQGYYVNAIVDEYAIWNGTLGPVPTISMLYPQSRRLIV
jgi:hypothetical protein